MGKVSLGILAGSMWLLFGTNLAAHAADAVIPESCADDEVLNHVLGQFTVYGPRSRTKEYFGFIYRLDGRISSAVTSGDDCEGLSECIIDTRFARKRIPRGARVLGEWHTHPHIGVHSLSVDDVEGANSNRRIRCYSAFYSDPVRNIYRWSTDATSVADAMGSLVLVGSYSRPGSVARKRREITPTRSSRAAFRRCRRPLARCPSLR
jgi:hypothetical protein